MDRGFFNPALIVFVSLLLIGTIGYVGYGYNMRAATAPSVEGASKVNAQGLSVLVNSTSTWDLSQYFCKTIKECEESLYAGFKGGVISGGQTTSREIFINNKIPSSEYAFVKIFLKPGWGMSHTEYRASLANRSYITSTKRFSDVDFVTEVIIFPTSRLSDTNYLQLATFSNL